MTTTATPNKPMKLTARIPESPTPTPMKTSNIARRRKRLLDLVESLPEATATPCGDRHLSLEVRRKRFGYFLDDHHGDGRLALNCKAASGVNQTLAARSPERFHVPKYVGHHGWIGLWLDLPDIDWAEVREILTDAYRLTASNRLHPPTSD
jgi:hypothetical protein